MLLQYLQGFDLIKFLFKLTVYHSCGSRYLHAKYLTHCTSFFMYLWRKNEKVFPFSWHILVTVLLSGTLKLL